MFYGAQPLSLMSASSPTAWALTVAVTDTMACKASSQGLLTLRLDHIEGPALPALGLLYVHIYLLLLLF